MCTCDKEVEVEVHFTDAIVLYELVAGGPDM
jgi:hypothetical protein